MNKLKLSGLIFFLAGSFVLMGIITAEAMYPTSYTTFKNEISDLGGTKPPNSLIYQPSASIFNTTFLLAGLMVLIATFYQHQYFKKLLFTIPVCLFGLGLTGIGIFPGNVSPYHGMSSMLTFLAGGLSPILSFKIVLAPFKYIGIVFGLVALATWFLAVFSPVMLFPVIGMGGTERWIAYPIMLWLTGFGGYLMSSNNKPY
jgi:hypothetical membrane protein